MRAIDRHLNRILTRLRNSIRERGFTQREVQNTLAWGHSYITQLLHRQKPVRVDQLLMILNVIGVKPETFFAEIYAPGGTYRRDIRARQPAVELEGSALLADLRRLRSLAEALASVLQQKNLITAVDLAAAVKRFRSEGADVERPSR